MRRTSWLVLGAICVVLALLVVVRVSGGSGQTDEQQILAMVEKGRSAIEHKDIKTAFSFISPDYSDSVGNNPDRLRAFVIQAFRSQDRYRVYVTEPRVSVLGDRATADLQVRMVGTSEGQEHELFNDPMQISLRREGGRRWLIVPSKTWRIIGMTNFPSTLGD